MLRRTLPARPRAWWPIGAGIAAALALVVVLWPGLRPDVPIRCYAASDRIESVQLPDGSSVRLDLEIGRAHVCTPVTIAPLGCRILLEKKNNTTEKLQQVH